MVRGDGSGSKGSGSGPGSSSSNKRDGDNEVPLIGVIVADSFDRRFAPIIDDESSSLSNIKVANIAILNYTLEWLSRTEIRKIIIVIESAHQSAVQHFVEDWHDHFAEIKLVLCQNCMSIGDAIREVDARSLIESDFLLVTNPATFCTTDLVPQIKAYRERRKENKNNVMTLIYTKSGTLNPIIGLERKTNKLVLYHRDDDSAIFDIDKGLFVGDTMVRRDLSDSGIALCSMSISAQFSDNFDYQHRDDIVREIIVNEEILSQSIHIDILPDNYVAFSISDYESILRANRLILQRWLTPLLPGRVGNGVGVGADRYIATRNNLFFAITNDDYDQNMQNLSRFTCSAFNAGPNVVIGLNCTIARAVTLKNAAIGHNVQIGECSKVINSIIGSNTQLGCNVEIIDSYVGDNVKIADNSIIGPKCIIANKVSISKKATTISSESVICNVACADDEEDIQCVQMENGYEWKFVDGSSFWRASAKRRERYDSSATGKGIESEMQKSDEEDVTEKEMDSTEKFFEEVKESMERIASVDDSNGANLMRNLILEINSSKLAYNISMEDVAKYVMLAFLSLQHNGTFKALQSLVKKWKLLFQNYYKPKKSQINGLIAIEEYLNSEVEFKSICAKTIHMFYEEDIFDEDAILEWNESLSIDSSMHNIVEPIIQWLKQADSDSDSQSDS